MTRHWLITLQLGIIVALVYLFVVGIGAMGHGFMLLGEEFSDSIIRATESPFVALFVGILATSLVQSSSTTTSIIVGLVAGGALSTQGAIFMVMGTNIGTTITSTIVSLAHITRSDDFRRTFAAATVHDFFNFMAVAVLFPVELATGLLTKISTVLAGTVAGLGGLKLGDPIGDATTPVVRALAGLTEQNGALLLIVAAILTIGTLLAIVRVSRRLVYGRIESVFSEHLFRSSGRSMLLGAGITVLVQSSSISTSLVIPLVGAGLLNLTQVFPYTLGANIGTTVTANLVALSTGNAAAVTVSLAHLLFNVFGICLIWPVGKVRRIPILLAERMSAATMRTRLAPVIYIVLAFFALPFVAILVWD